MISLKKLLTAGDGAECSARTAWLILEAVACHAVEIDPAERETFQTSLRAFASQMDSARTQGEALLHVGEAINCIESYNRAIQRSINAQMKELQSIVSIFTRSLLQVSKGSAASADKLRQIERKIEKCSQTSDLRALKMQLEESLDAICGEASEQQRRSEQLDGQIQETMNRPEASAAMTEAVAELDLVTGLPNFRAADRAIRAAVAPSTEAHVVLFQVDRVELINNRFGFAVGDRILMLFGQHLAQRFSQNDQLFRWRGPSFLALIERKGPEMAIRAEIARMVSERLEQQIELGGRSVLLPIAASWTLIPLKDTTPDAIVKKLDGFATGQPGTY